MLRLLIAGIAMIPAGIMLFGTAWQEDSIAPQGYWQGPLVMVLGIVLIVISGRSLAKGE